MKEKKIGAAPAASDERAVQPAVRIEHERANFKTLLLKNPNHFGNMPKLGLPLVKALSQSKLYEELTCIGLHPEGNRLQAIVQIKRDSGYSGGTCTDGSVEYVRFFVRRPGGWHNLGVASFTSYDLPAGSPLPVSYSVEMEMDEARKYCTVENVVEVRGILSWSLEPPEDPDWTPTWGNVLTVKVQIAPRQPHQVKIATLIEDKLITIDPSILKLVDLGATFQPVAQLQQLSYATLKERYAGKDVPGHRFGFTEAQKLIQQPLTATLLTQLAGAKKRGDKAFPGLPDLGLFGLFTDLFSFFDNLVQTKGNPTYEELDCVGYNPQTRMLSGVITIKRNSGYSGSLCEEGSTEYVGFWAFYGGAWHFLGNSQVRVHDLDAVSAGNPVRYAVFRGAHLPEQLCNDVRGIPLRAILSWNVPPTGPDFDPVWGNVVNTHVQPIITKVSPGDQRVRLLSINGANIEQIDSSGRAQHTAEITLCNGNDSPFGGPIYIRGDLLLERSDAYFNSATGAILPGQHPPAYQVFVRKVGSTAAPTQLTNSFGLRVFPVNPPAGNPTVGVLQEIRSVGGADYYLYYEGDLQRVEPPILSIWQASGLEEGLYEIEVKGFKWDGVAYTPLDTPSQIQQVYVYNGYPHTELDVNGNTFLEKSPQVRLSITSHKECGDAQVGDIIEGEYEVVDYFFGSLSIDCLQITIGGLPQPDHPVVPSGVTFSPPTVTTNGTSGTWRLNTGSTPANPTPMTPCGYTIVLSAQDRALVGPNCDNHYNSVAVGFCLREKSGKP
ncbi:MAG TPA: hypothetical protein VMW27_15690 [Thermoanaerobaculia bacterium]|nr:hypothetical protein [Thermoanaerobaculia bacterium]